MPMLLRCRRGVLCKQTSSRCSGRVPVFRSIHDNHHAPTFKERLSRLRQNGTPEIAIGSLIIAVVGVDYMLQLRNDQHRQDTVKQLEMEVHRDAILSRKEDQELITKGLEPKFKCVIRAVPDQFDGHKVLRNCKVGDVVDVIEEGVGPDRMYNLCSITRRTPNTDNEQGVSIGWFPTSCLQKVDESNS